MSLTGLVLQFSYRLQRHIRFSQPLARWLGLLLLVLAGWSLYRWWPFAWQAALLIGLILGDDRGGCLVPVSGIQQITIVMNGLGLHPDAQL